MNNRSDLAQAVRQAAQSSQFLADVASLNRDGGMSAALRGAPTRSLTEAEIAELERHGNTAENWQQIQVAEPLHIGAIRNCCFWGRAVLGSFQSPVALSEAITIPSGLSGSTIMNCVVGHNAAIRDVKLIANYVVQSNAALCNCGSITCEGATAFGNGMELPVGVETGGREVAVFAEIDVALAARVARARSSNPDALVAYGEAVAEYTKCATSSLGLIAESAVLRDTAQIRNCYLGTGARVHGATLLADSTVLSSQQESSTIDSGACVMQSIVQWSSSVSTMAIVDRSVLCEHSHAERHGKVTDSIVGPNSGVAEGEATACLLGPFVGFHHQALLIAALWPEGKGNVGYGANVGSNHTSKAPDQEFWPGEGLFLGLGVNVKFPADFSRSPYSILASGVSTLPQKVSFPFSLINNPSANHPEISPAYNEIIPAWLLTDNIYTVKRNEGKYKSRNKARRSTFQFDVFVPATIDLLLDASHRLESVSEIRSLYTEREIPGLGKNFLLERHRQPAIDAYRFYSKYYALHGLLQQVERVIEAGQRSRLDRLLNDASNDPTWNHQRALLIDPFPIRNVATGLKELPEILEKIARDVERAKAKDDHRGKRIIDDYADVHTEAAKDKFVVQTWQETRESIRRIEQLVAEL